MTGMQDLAGSPATLRHQAGGVQALQVAASRLADIKRGSPIRTRELVNLLLGHAARSWRASQPYAAVSLSVRSPHGHSAIRMRLPAAH